MVLYIICKCYRCILQISMEDKSIKDKHTKELNQKMKPIEATIQKKAVVTELQKF